jgi:ferredoxin
MKVIVDFDLCDSNGVCCGVAPEVFELDDENFLVIKAESPGDELREQLDEAVRSCPTGAISLAEA